MARFTAKALVVAAAILPALPLAPAYGQVGDLGSGAWCWFADPRAITSDGRTYVGWVSPEGDIVVSSVDLVTGDRVAAVLDSRFNVDDHANPALQLRHDGRLVVYYSAHVGDAMLYRVSERPGDITSWGPRRQIPTNTPGDFGFTYPNPQHLEAEARTYLFWRGGNFQPAFSTLADGDSAWTPARALIDSGAGRPYVKFAGDGNRTIHFAFTNQHPNEYADVNIHYAAYRDGEIVGADGAVIGSLDAPIAPEDADLVFDRPENAWVHDVAIDATGRPIIVFASFPSIAAHQYHYAVWTGEQWAVHDITAAGGSFHPGTREPMYSGGLTLDHDDPSRVYLSREVDGGWQIERWSTADGGHTWESAPLSAPGANFRPISPRGHLPESGPMSVLWMSGDYRAYINYDTRIVGASDRAASPVLDVEWAPQSGISPLTVSFDAAGIEGDGEAAGEWSWQFGDGGTDSTGPRVEHSFVDPGVYFPSVTVADADGRRHTFVTEVTVAPAPPVPPQDGEEGTPVAPPSAGRERPHDPSSSGATPATPLLRIDRLLWTALHPRIRVSCRAVRACRGRLSARLTRSRLLAGRRFRVEPGGAAWVSLRLTRRGRRFVRRGRRRSVLVLALNPAGRVYDASRLRLQSKPSRAPR